LLSPSQFRDLVSGRRRGLPALLARGLLRLAEFPYTAEVRRRNRAFDGGRRTPARVEVPVISVGNLTLGGTGKTPLVAWIARWLRDRDVRVTIISRGWAAGPGGRNDEAIELEQSLRDVPHLQNRDRVAAARTAIDELDCQTILLDDGFQHRRLARDLDIVLLDALEPFGFGHVFPRGTLREPVEGLARAGVIVLSRADLADAAQRLRIRDEVNRHAPDAAWAEIVHAPRELITSGGRRAPLNQLTGKPVAAFCGIGNPAGFRHTLSACGFRIAGFREFADHHAFTRDDVTELTEWADNLKADALVCTHKDLVKLDVDRLGDKPLWALKIAVVFQIGQDLLERRLAGVVGRR